jgi:hypothetical protein
MDLEIKDSLMKMPMIWALSSCARINGREGAEVVKAFGEVMLGYSLFHLGSEGTYKLLDALRDQVEERLAIHEGAFAAEWDEQMKKLQLPE